MVDAKDVDETHGTNIEERGQWLSPEATFGDGDVLGTPEGSLGLRNAARMDSTVGVLSLVGPIMECFENGLWV